MIPDALLPLIKRFEGCYLKAYLCPAGVPTIGWGATGPDIQLGLVWTQEQADARLMLDAQRFTVGTMRLCPGAKDDQLAALTDFAFNLGLGRLKQSTMRKRFLAGDIDGARRELAKWNRGGGRVLRGLVARRAAEAALLYSR